VGTFDFGLLNNCGAAPPTATKVLSIKNTGGKDLNVTSASVTSGSTFFTVTPSVLTIAAGETATLTVTGTLPVVTTPTNPAASQGGTLTLVTNEPQPGNTYTVELTVTPYCTMAILKSIQPDVDLVTTSDAPLVFTATCDSEADPVAQTIYIKNNGSGSLTSTGWTARLIKSQDAGQFSFSSDPASPVFTTGGSFPTSGNTASFTVYLIDPTPSGTPNNELKAQIAVTSGITGDPVRTIYLKATLLGDALSISAGPTFVNGTMDFGSVWIGDNSTSVRTFTITNNANAATDPAKVTVTSHRHFTISAINGVSLTGNSNPLSQDVTVASGGGTATVDITFAPFSDDVAGSHGSHVAFDVTDSNTICGGGGSTHISEAVTGTFTDAPLAVNPVSFNFGPVACGTTAQTAGDVIFTLANTGSEALSVKGLKVQVSDSDPTVSAFYALQASLTDGASWDDVGASIQVPTSLEAAQNRTFDHVLIKVIPQSIAKFGDQGPAHFVKTLTDANGVLTFTTNLETGVTHKVELTMTPQGAIIDDTPAAPDTTWTFQDTACGSIGHNAFGISNSGNQAVLVEISLTETDLSNVFGLSYSDSPTDPPLSSLQFAGTSASTTFYGAFAPSSASGDWSNTHGTLNVTAVQDGVICRLPAGWNQAPIVLSGKSTSALCPPI
jgi:hypothetical protein